jgi:hypothetical protein
MTLRTIKDIESFKIGWNAALDEVIKTLPAEEKDLIKMVTKLKEMK